MRNYPASLAWGSLPPSSLPDVSFQPHGYLFLATQVTIHQDRAHCNKVNLFIYQARESSLIPVGFLTALFPQKTLFMKPLM